MTSRPVLEPTTEHPITINPTQARVVVRVNGEVVADTHDALQLQESTYPAVQYIPLERCRARAAHPHRHQHLLPVQG